MKCCCPCLLATLAGAETFVEIALFGVKKRELLRRFLPFAKSTPSHDPLGDLFATLDAQCFQRCFAAIYGAVRRRGRVRTDAQGPGLCRYQRHTAKNPPAERVDLDQMQVDGRISQTVPDGRCACRYNC